jgi:type IV pilus assembly protein PilQ
MRIPTRATASGEHRGRGAPAPVLAGQLVTAGALRRCSRRSCRIFGRPTWAAGRRSLRCSFSDTPPDASIFAIDSPPRIALDLPGVSNRLADRTTNLNLGPLQSVTAVEAGDRTRVILNLSTRSTDYRSHVDGNNLILTIVRDWCLRSRAAAPWLPKRAPPTRGRASQRPLPGRPGVRSARPPEINDIDFRRGSRRAGSRAGRALAPGVTVDVVNRPAGSNSSFRAR